VTTARSNADMQHRFVQSDIFALIGWPLGRALAGVDPEWLMAGMAEGLIVVAIPLSQKFNRQVKQAVDVYNGPLRESSFLDKRELKFPINEQGAGFVFNF
jgi:hypothetical protein